MKTYMILPLLLSFLPSGKAQEEVMTPTHASSRFKFTLPVSLKRAAPLFGPEAERCWAGPQWNPEFVYPQPGKDVQGAVFTVQNGNHKAVWINTVFDTASGHMQYVSFIPDVFVFTVDVRLRMLSFASTEVEVTYVRTALSAAAAEQVRSMSKKDLASGPHWQQAILDCLAEQDKLTR